MKECPFCKSKSVKIEYKSKQDWKREKHEEAGPNCYKSIRGTRCSASVRCNKCYARGPVFNTFIPADKTGSMMTEFIKKAQDGAIEAWDKAPRQI